MLSVLVISALLMQAAPAVPSVTPPAIAPAAAAPQAAPVAPVVAPVAPVAAPAAPAPVAPTTAVTPPAPAKPTMVKVDAYHESSGDRTDSGIWSAFNAKQSQSGPMEGTWIVTAADGRKLVSFELRVDATSQRLDGAWRSLTNDVGLTRSGFLSDLFLDGPSLEIDYAAGRTQTPNVLELRQTTGGQWQGVLLDPAGHATDVVMSQSVHAG